MSEDGRAAGTVHAAAKLRPGDEVSGHFLKRRRAAVKMGRAADESKMTNDQ